MLRVRKKDGGAEYAVKIFTGTTLQEDSLTLDVLMELKALFKARPRCCHGCALRAARRAALSFAAPRGSRLRCALRSHTHR